MKLSDKAWRIVQHYGIRETTVSDCTRGDSTCDEFFLTEREAWLAEAERSAREAERHEHEADQARRRQRGALEKAKQLGAENA